MRAAQFGGGLQPFFECHALGVDIVPDLVSGIDGRQSVRGTGRARIARALRN